MGVGLVPFYDPQVTHSASYNGDGKGLAKEFAVLERIASEAGQAPLSHFASDALLEGESGTQLARVFSAIMRSAIYCHRWTG